MFVYYDECILKYIASIRKRYGLTSSFESDSSFDELLKKKDPKKIFLLLIDGMGVNLVNRKLDQDSFLRRNMHYKATSVFPPTTTAATTSILSAKAPNETAWLGWVQHLEEVEDDIIPFFGRGFYSKKEYGKDLMQQVIPVKDIVKELNEKGINARKLFPAFEEDGCESFDVMCERLSSYSKESDFSFIYAYWDAYDTLMHEKGPSDSACDEMLRSINERLEMLANDLDEETMLVVIADHGQVDIREEYNLKGSEFEQYFYQKPSIEPRAQTFFIKEEDTEVFEKRFKECFEDRFILLTKEQVLESKLFGVKKNHPRFVEMLGEYLAIAKGDLCFSYREAEDTFRFKGAHAGITDDELYVPVIVYQK